MLRPSLVTLLVLILVISAACAPGLPLLVNAGGAGGGAPLEDASAEATPAEIADGAPEDAAEELVAIPCAWASDAAPPGPDCDGGVLPPGP